MDTALTVGKEGYTALWAGSNAEQYWFFELTGDDEVWYGTHSGNAADGSAMAGPLPVAPAAVPYLLGCVGWTPRRAARSTNSTATPCSNPRA